MEKQTSTQLADRLDAICHETDIMEAHVQKLERDCAETRGTQGILASEVSHLFECISDSTERMDRICGSIHNIEIRMKKLECLQNMGDQKTKEQIAGEAFMRGCKAFAGIGEVEPAQMNPEFSREEEIVELASRIEEFRWNIRHTRILQSLLARLKREAGKERP